MVVRDDLRQHRLRFASSVESSQQRQSRSVREARRSKRRHRVGLQLGAEVTLFRYPLGKSDESSKLLL